MNIAIIGAGSIAEKMATTVNALDGFDLYAIGSRTKEKAKKFQEKFNIKKAYGSYEELVKDDEIDLVYIAVPHSHHYKVAKLCLENNKNVLCEKAFTVNAKQAKELLELAKKKNIFISEAIWTRYMPSRFLIKELIDSKIVGEIRQITANLCYNIMFKERIVQKELAGGALLDLGVYLVHFASTTLGNKVKEITATTVKHTTGVDKADSIVFTYEDGKMAYMNCSVDAISDRKGTLYGEKGYIEVINVNNPEKILVYDENYKLIKEVEIPEQITGFEYQLLSCKKAIEEGKIQCEEIPHEDIIDTMEKMDKIREIFNYEIPIIE